MIAALLLISAPITLIEPSCAASWIDSRVLLEVLSVDTSSRSVSAIALEILDCDSGADDVSVAISVREGELVRRKVSVADVAPEGRTRTLGLAIQGMIPPFTRLNAAPPIEPARPDLSTTIMACGVARAPADGTPWLLGVRLQGGRWLGSHRLGIEIELGTATSQHDLQVHADLHVLALGLSYLFGWRDERFHAGAGLVLLGGAATVAADALRPGLVASSHAGPLVSVGVRGEGGIALTDHAFLAAQLDVSGQIVGLEGRFDDRVLIGLKGISIALAIGVGARF